MMNKRLQFFLMIIAASFFLGACDPMTVLPTTPDVAQLQNDQFYLALQANVLKLQIPVIVAGAISLLFGWKLKRFGLAIDGFVIGGFLLYTYLVGVDFIPNENFRIGLSIVGAVIIGILAYFLYNLMALLIGGFIGSTLLNGAWIQVADTVPPQLLVFLSTFVSALIMFLVFRLFLVAFSAVIGAAILMLAVPFEFLWVIPVAAIGTVFQISLALWMKDDIFKNIRGDFGAAFGQAFGELLGPFGTLRDYQKSSKEQSPQQHQVAQPKAEAPKPKPEAKPAPQAQYQAPKPAPAQPQYQAPKPAPQQPPYQPPQQSYQASQQPYQAPQPAPQPYQAPNPAPAQQSYQSPQQQPYQAPSVPPQANPPAANLPTEANAAFRPENYQLVLSTGRSFPLVGSHITVGRNEDNVIVLNDSQVSGYHLMLSIQAGGVVAWDNNSTNGTLLNGQTLVGAYRLTTNDVLQVGSVSLRLVRVDFQ